MHFGVIVPQSDRGLRPRRCLGEPGHRFLCVTTMAISRRHPWVAKGSEPSVAVVEDPFLPGKSWRTGQHSFLDILRCLATTFCRPDRAGPETLSGNCQLCFPLFEDPDVLWESHFGLFNIEMPRLFPLYRNCASVPIFDQGRIQTSHGNFTLAEKD